MNGTSWRQRTFVLWLATNFISLAAMAEQLSATFTNPAPMNYASFGLKLAPLGSDRVIVGSHANTDFTGVAYLFGTNGTLLATFTNPAPIAQSFFGEAIASIGTDHVLVGAYGAVEREGAAYLFDTNGYLSRIVLNPNAQFGDQFGAAAVAVGTDRFLIGAAGAGAAYLFNIDGFALQAFYNPAPNVEDNFGRTLAAVGTDKVLIGAPGKDDEINLFNSGVAYLFSTNGTLLTTFTNPSPSSYSYFGFPLTAVGTDKVAIAAVTNRTGITLASVIYLFSTDGTLLNTLTNPFPTREDAFPGTSESLTSVGDDKLLVGTYYHTVGPFLSGAAYLLGLDGKLLSTFTDPAPTFGGFFGYAVAALDTNHVVIASIGNDDGTDNSGVAYLFRALPSRHDGEIDDLVPCGGPIAGGTWKNHPQYVGSVIRTAHRLRKNGEITRSESRMIIRNAKRSDCGKKR